MAHNIVQLDANMDIDGERAFEATFAPTAVDEILLEFDPKHSGPAVIHLSNDSGGRKEIHPTPQRGREGRMSAHFAHDAAAGTWSKLRVSMLRGVKAKLIKVKLIAKAPASA
jgi:hypothetical protein